MIKASNRNWPSVASLTIGQRSNSHLRKSIALRVRQSSKGQPLSISVCDEAGGVAGGVANALRFGWSGTPYAPVDDSRQAHRSRMSPLAGLGVGLPLARTHARLMGGSLSLASSSDGATEATMSFPANGVGVPAV